MAALPRCRLRREGNRTRLRQRFGYVFAGQFGYPTIVDLEVLDRKIHAGFGIGWCQMPHGRPKPLGFRFETDGKSISYATDFSAITNEMVELFAGTDILVSDCLRREPHPTHANLAMALELAGRCRAKKTVLTHLDKSLDYASLQAEVPPACWSVTMGWSLSREPVSRHAVDRRFVRLAGAGAEQLCRVPVQLEEDRNDGVGMGGDLCRDDRDHRADTGIGLDRGNDRAHLPLT